MPFLLIPSMVAIPSDQFAQHGFGVVKLNGTSQCRSDIELVYILVFIAEY